MGLADRIVAALVLAGALYLLYRSLRKSQGGCHGCSSGGCRSRPRDPGELVPLGRPPGGHPAPPGDGERVARARGRG